MDVNNYHQLGISQQIVFAKRIEAGIYASELMENAQRTRDVNSCKLLELVVSDGKLAYNEFYLANLGLVAKISENWASRAGLGFEELFQEGCIGLGEAIQKWDYKRGYKFATLAWKMISSRVSAISAIRCGQIDAKISSAKLSWQIKKQWAELEKTSGETLNSKNFSDISGRNISQITKALAIGPHAGLSTIGDVAQPNEQLNVGLPQDWADLLDSQERKLIMSRFLNQETTLTLTQVAKNLGLSLASASRIQRRALRKLRVALMQAA